MTHPAAAGYSPVPIALRSASWDAEESRSFLQRRLGLYAGWVFVLSSGFFVIEIIQMAVAPGFTPASLLSGGHGPHLAASTAAGTLWAATKLGRWSMRVLRILDAAGLVAICAGFALMGLFFILRPNAGQPAVIGLLVSVLACSHTVMARAIAVPSRATWTAAVTAAAMAPLVLIFAAVPARVLGVIVIMPAAIGTACWCVTSTVLATLGSRIIFGLRREAAMVKRLGQYTLEEKIGEGAMGAVYRARHALLRRPTAIKLLPPEKAGEASVRRFEREVQHTAQLSHPNTVAIYDYGRTPNGTFYYAMEFLPGIDLDGLVRRDGRQPATRVVHILQQACGALAEAHDLGLVHRDIKPANILLTERGGEPDVVKVVDFGLVKELESGSQDATVTSTATLAGTPLYMAPEAIRSDERVDGRSDLYALGAVGYFLLTGQPVFEGRTIVEVCAQHLHAQPVAPSERAGVPVPPALERIILDCLAKPPEERPANARALRERLARCGVPPWTSEDAARWWAAYRESPDSIERAAPISATEAMTVAVDLAER